MSTNERPDDRMAVPAPPGGHPLRINPNRPRHAPVTHNNPSVGSSDLPIAEETSAGGLVVKFESGSFFAAVIARRNRAGRLEWCLPKGHLEGEETAEEAAIREIQEETGITGEIRRPLGKIDYWFTGDDRRVHKVVHHFLLDASGGFLTVEGDPDSEAEDVEWISFSELGDRLSYPNERRLAAIAHGILLERRAENLRRLHAPFHREGDSQEKPEQ
ncbi:NUDIX domain-containing protein [Timonella senegalensis]|uniref:NUDIX domain-containing protein n=1 Tax=Timonella senegalensis TaxID=1465825 RepID=UPI0002FEDABB|nr:NUDIX hydrolase [Timonella senegalensis]